jgi:hypothetical protein
MADHLKLSFAALSVGASVDQQTGNLSVFDLIEEIRTPQVPVQIQSLVISLSLEKSVPGAFVGRLMIHLFTPDGGQATVGSGEMEFPDGQKRMKAVFRFAGFPIQQFGNHRFVLSWLDPKGQKAGEAILDFEVTKFPVPAPVPAQGGKSGAGSGTPEKPPLSH